MKTINKEENTKVNLYLAVNSVKPLSSSALDQKVTPSYKVSDKELGEDIYSWDPAVRRFIRLRR